CHLGVHQGEGEDRNTTPRCLSASAANEQLKWEKGWGLRVGVWGVCVCVCVWLRGGSDSLDNVQANDAPGEAVSNPTDPREPPNDARPPDRIPAPTPSA